MTYLVTIEIAAGLATMALYRKFISLHEDIIIHLGPGEERHIPEQATLARRLRRIDRWGEVMTVATAAGGILLAVLYLTEAWEKSLLPW
jgi:hypothetical protein